MQVELAFGSDFPVESADPGLGLWAAMNRTDLDGRPEGGWQPDQRLTEEEAILAFTEGPNILAGTEKRYGHLDTRMDADLTAWRLEGLHGHQRWIPVATIVDGEVVWTSLE
jgi:predicted amidohydrolase YtcJ